MFSIVLSNVLVMLAYMTIGVLLSKGGKAQPAHAKSLSGLLIYALSPAMLIGSFLKIEYTSQTFSKIGKFFLVTLLIQLLFFILLYVLLHRKYENARYRILSIGAVLGNVGFFGMPVLNSIFPEEPIVLCYSSINVMSMNLLVFTIGIFLITNDRKYISVKGAFLNPTTLSILAALPFYFFKIDLPELVTNAIDIMGKATTPMCMIILGIRLSAANKKELFTRPFVYATCILKLVAFPVFAFVCVKWLPFLDSVAKTAVFVLAAAPSGAVIESLAELHECEQELSANVVLMTTLLSVITMPLVLLVLS